MPKHLAINPFLIRYQIMVEFQRSDSKDYKALGNRSKKIKHEENCSKEVWRANEENKTCLFSLKAMNNGQRGYHYKKKSTKSK